MSKTNTKMYALKTIRLVETIFSRLCATWYHLNSCLREFVVDEFVTLLEATDLALTEFLLERFVTLLEATYFTQSEFLLEIFVTLLEATDSLAATVISSRKWSDL